MALGAAQPMIMSLLHQITPSSRHGQAVAMRILLINVSSVSMPMLFGTAGGVGLGLFLGWAMVEALADEGFTDFAVPVTSLVVVLVVGALAGVLAAVRPARRAARLDVLEAIATD